MKLTSLYENRFIDRLINAIGLRTLKKMQDPGRHQIDQAKLYPQRSGNQDTPLKPRHRRFFNAPIGAIQTKTGYGKHDFETRRPKMATVDDDQPTLDYPIDKTEPDKDIEKRARRTYGHLSMAGQRPRHHTS